MVVSTSHDGSKPGRPGPPPVWSLAETELLRAVESRREGLGAAEAAERLARDGRNAVTDESERPVVVLLLRQLRSPLVLILVFAAAITASLRNWLEAAVILAIVLGSAALGFTQEFRASAAVAKLRRRLALTARVRRDGGMADVPFDEIVTGDVIRLCAGAVVPADAVVLDAQDLLVSEAALTGESFPVSKRPGATPADSALSRRSNMVFLGSSVRSGMGEAVVVRTGRGTEYGAIAARLQAKPTETAFARGIRRFGAMLTRVMVVIVLFVLTVNELGGRPFIESLLFSVALGVGMSPELLPAIISITLSAGARRMADAGVLIRRLEAIEDLGAMTVFCTDKTGTLTEGAIVLTQTIGPDGKPSDALARWARLNAGLQTGIDNPLDAAVLKKLGEPPPDEDWVKAGEIPYDFSRKRLSVVVRSKTDPNDLRLVCKGAFTNVLALCGRCSGSGAMDEATRARIEADYRRLSAEGFRVIAVATRRLEAEPCYGAKDEADLEFEGLLVFVDPPKPEAAAAMKRLADLGVAVKVVSGDNRHVVAHVAREIGLGDARVLTGEELSRMKDEALWALADRVRLYAEVDPQQKERIVRALQRIGHAVGYLGDGINDAPALYAADVGVSVDQAVDVARESADVVLLRRDLDVLRLGVEGGRRAFANTLKYIAITISANFGNMVSMALAAPLLPFIPMAAKQILLNNFLSDLPAIALSSDTVDASEIARPQRFSVKGIQWFMVLFGLLSSVFDILAFVILLRFVRAGEPLFQTAWFLLSLLTELAALLLLRTRLPAWRSRPSRLIVVSSLAVGAAGIAAVYFAPTAELFSFVAMPADALLAVALLFLGYAAATEAAKLWFYRPRPVRRAARRRRPRG